MSKNLKKQKSKKMAFPIVPLIGAAASLGSQLFNNSSTQSANRENYKFQQQMYERQRADSLADWNRQNEYNSPAAQMQRFKEGGLNPHLIYGQSNMAPAVRGASPGNYDHKPQQIDMGAVLGEYVNLRRMELSNDLIEKQTELARQQADLTAQRYAYTMQQSDESASRVMLNHQKFHFLNETNPITLDIAKNKRDLGQKEVLNYDEKLNIWKRVQNQQVANGVQQVLNGQAMVLRSQIQNEVDAVRKTVLEKQLESIEAGIKLTNVRRDLTQKEVDYYEVKNAFNVVGKLLGNVTNVLPKTQVKKFVEHRRSW